MNTQAGGVPSFSSLAHSSNNPLMGLVSSNHGNTDTALLSRSVPAYPSHFAQAFNLSRNSFPQAPQAPTSVVYSSTNPSPQPGSNNASNVPHIKLEGDIIHQPNSYSFAGYNGYTQEFKRYEENNQASYFGAYNFAPTMNSYHPKTTNSATGFEPSSPIAAPYQLLIQYTKAHEVLY
jgi:hypothetical protein